jgi:hypothetical protein
VATLERTEKSTAAEKLQFVFRQLTAMTARLITTLKMFGHFPYDFKNLCKIRGKDAERFAGELVRQCPAPSHLDLCENELGFAGQKVLQRCWGSAQRWLTSISRNDIEDVGERGFNLRDVVKPVVFFHRLLVLFAAYHLFRDRQPERATHCGYTMW